VSIVRQRWLRLAYGAVIMISVGFIYGWSIFSEPFKAEFGWDAQTLSLTFSILMVCFCLGGILGARVMARTSVRVVLIAAALCACIGFFGALRVTENAPWILYVTYGTFAGLTSGISYNAVLGAVVPWFPDRTGLVSGLLLMCYGCATMILGSAAAVMFTAVGWRKTFIVLAIFITIVLVVGAFVQKRPTQAQSQALLALLSTRTRGPARAVEERGAEYEDYEYSRREQGVREQGVREQGAREQGTREQGVREQGTREQGARGSDARALRVHGLKTHTLSTRGSDAQGHVPSRHPNAIALAETVPDVDVTTDVVARATAAADEAADAIEAVAHTHRPAGAQVTATPHKPVPISRFASVHDYSTRQMLRHPAFYVYGIWMLLLGSTALAFTGSANQIALSFGLSPTLGVAFVSLMSIGNAAGRFLWGFVFDIAPPTLVMLLIALLHSIGAALLIVSFVLGSPILLGCAFVLYSLAMSGNPVMGSGFMAKFFGPSHYAANLSILNAINIPNALIGPTVASLVFMATASFLPTFSVLAIGGLLAIACVAVLQGMTVQSRRKRFAREAAQKR
jgi:MFS family permease